VHIGPFRGRRVMAYLSGEMTGRERDRFEAHLRRCVSCMHEVESRRPVVALLEDDAATELSVPETLGERIRARLREPEPSTTWAPRRIGQAAVAAAAMCFLAVGLAIGYIAGRPTPLPDAGRTATRELPQADEEKLLGSVLAARQRLVAAGAEEEADSLEDVGRLLEQLAELKGNDISYVQVAVKMPSPPAEAQPIPPYLTTPDMLKKAYEHEIAAHPGTPQAALAQVKLADLHYRLGNWPLARHAYATFKRTKQYEEYAHRAEVDQRLQLLDESYKRGGYKTLALFREAATLDGTRAYNAYEQIIRRQPTGQLARMTVMEMARFDWPDGRSPKRTVERFGTPREKIAGLNKLISYTSSPDIGALAQATIGDIYRDELDDLRAASNAYELVVEKYPRTRMASEALGRMNRLTVALAP